MISPNVWSGKTLGRFMRFFGPLSSLFDLITFAFFISFLCPALTGGLFPELSPPPCRSSMPSCSIPAGFWNPSGLRCLFCTCCTKHLPSAQSSAFRHRLAGDLRRPSAADCSCLSAGGVMAKARASALILFLHFSRQLSSLTCCPLTLAKRWYIKKYHELL